ncbi:hypothetical protein KCU76_g52, partial [Aureobasidium melanogenum]
LSAKSLSNQSSYQLKFTLQQVNSHILKSITISDVVEALAVVSCRNLEVFKAYLTVTQGAGHTKFITTKMHNNI